MKRKISKAQYDALNEALKAHYKVEGDNYVLQIEDDADNDPAELRRARDREKQAAKDEKERADALQKKLNEIGEGTARRNGDIDSLEKSWKQKLADKETELGNAITKLKDSLKKLLVKDKAATIANDLAGESATLLVPHIEARLQADLDGAEPITRVLDIKGNLSALTLDDLQKEIVADKRFSAIIVASRASGGATGRRSTGNAAAVLGSKKFRDLNDKERTELFRADPVEFKRLSEADRIESRKL